MKAPTPIKKEKEKDKKDKDDEKDKDGEDKEKEKESEEKEKEKKMVTNDKKLLLSCSYFDLSHCGYFEAKVSCSFKY